jgi:hypothetical protein
MWKDFLDKGKCLLGFHDGPWQYRQPKNCTQVQKCERCGNETERIEHRWSGWAWEADGRCDRVRTCARCSQTEKSLNHNWGQPAYVRAGACDMVVTCARCKGKESRDAAHVFDAWVYRSDDECTQVQSCSRCGLAGSATRFEHEWNDWTRSEFYASKVRVCRHCGEMLIDAGVSPVSMQALDGGVAQLMASETGPQVRAALRGAQGALLTDAADKYFAFAFDQFDDDDFRSGPLTAARRVVDRCREVGVDAALQEFGIESPPAAPPSPAPQTPPPRAQQAGRTAPRPAPATGPMDQRLIGQWQNIEFLGRGTPMMMSIESYLALDGSGRFEFMVQGNEVEPGTWTADGNELRLNFETGESPSKLYVVDSQGMIWNNDSRFHLWRRRG